MLWFHLIIGELKYWQNLQEATEGGKSCTEKSEQA
jgi:hypothetical protein